MDDNKRMSDLISAPSATPLVLVLGMHRSGTSALTGLLSLAGLSAGDTLIEGHRDNPRGYFEHPGIVAAHDALLAALGRRWDDPRALPADWLDSDAARLAEAALVPLVEALAPQGRIPLVKDPRACRFVPLWQRVAERCGFELRVLFAIRDPAEVRASLGARDRLPASRADQLWLAHVLEAEQASRSLRRMAVGFDAALAEPAAVLASLAAVLDLALEVDAARIRSFMDASLRHHHAVAIDADDDDLAPAVFRAMAGTSLPGAVVMDAFMRRFERERALYAAGLEERWRGEHAASSLVEVPHADDAAAETKALVSALAMLAASSHAPEVPDPRLYLAAADGAFDEADSLVAAMDASGRAYRARFDLPPGRAADRVRFDPAQRAGLYVLESLRIDGRPVDLLARAAAAGGQAVPISGGLGLVATHGDPHWTIDLRTLAAAGACAEFHFRVESLAGLLGALDLPGRLAAIESHLASLDRKGDAVLAPMAAELASVAQHVAAMDQAVASRLTALDAASAALAQRMAAEAGEAAARHAEMQQRQADMQQRQTRQDEVLERLERRSALAHEWRRLAGALRAWFGGGRR